VLLRPAIARLAVLLVLLVARVAAAAPGAWDRPLSAKQQQRALRSVIKKVYKAAQRGERPVVVVDIDDTVSDGRVRLKTAAQTAGLNYKHLETGEDLYRGVPRHELAARKETFNRLYFNDEELQYLDSAQNGAPKFLRALQKAGGTVLYVSGRWESTRESTEAHLHDLGLPLGRREHLLLNPSEKMTAGDWKRSAKQIIASHGKPLATFDNEAESAADYATAFPGARSFRLATFRFREAPATKPRGLLVVRDFSLDR
jgi:hypothetical protein